MEPTVILTDDPKYVTMREEIFGPVITIYLFDDDKFEEALSLVDQTSEYALIIPVMTEMTERVNKNFKTFCWKFLCK